MAECKECIHDKVCPVWNYRTDDFAERNADTCKNYLPTADVVEVVRCKDCRYWENGKDYHPCCNHFGSMMTDTIADDFCSFGERKDNDSRKEN